MYFSYTWPTLHQHIYITLLAFHLHFSCNLQSLHMHFTCSSPPYQHHFIVTSHDRLLHITCTLRTLYIRIPLVCIPSALCATLSFIYLCTCLQDIDTYVSCMNGSSSTTCDTIYMFWKDLCRRLPACHESTSSALSYLACMSWKYWWCLDRHYLQVMKALVVPCQILPVCHECTCSALSDITCMSWKHWWCLVKHYLHVMKALVVFVRHYLRVMKSLVEPCQTLPVWWWKHW